MGSSPIHANNIESSSERTIGLIKAVLESGNSVELPASGYSMFPTLRPGDKVVVKPVTSGELPKPGDVVVYKKNIVFVMHRLIEIIEGNDGAPSFISRGDLGIGQDEPWYKQQFMGIAISYKRGEKENTIRSYIPGVWRYRLNRRLLWIYNRRQAPGVRHQG
jgi:signal peptidase I